MQLVSCIFPRKTASGITKKISLECDEKICRKQFFWHVGFKQIRFVCDVQHWNICHTCKWPALMCGFFAIWTGICLCLHAYLRRITVQDHSGKVKPRQNGEGGCQENNPPLHGFFADGWIQYFCGENWLWTEGESLWTTVKDFERVAEGPKQIQCFVYNCSTCNEWDVRSLWLTLFFYELFGFDTLGHGKNNLGVTTKINSGT